MCLASLTFMQGLFQSAMVDASSKAPSTSHISAAVVGLVSGRCVDLREIHWSVTGTEGLAWRKWDLELSRQGAGGDVNSGFLWEMEMSSLVVLGERAGFPACGQD